MSSLRVRDGDGFVVGDVEGGVRVDSTCKSLANSTFLRVKHVGYRECLLSSLKDRLASAIGSVVLLANSRSVLIRVVLSLFVQYSMMSGYKEYDF